LNVLLNSKKVTSEITRTFWLLKFFWKLNIKNCLK
jgi:hypothetical protein